MNTEGFWGSHKTQLWRLVRRSCKQGPRRAAPVPSLIPVRGELSYLGCCSAGLGF